MSDKKIKILKISIIVFCVSVFILLITNESYALFNKNVKTGVNLKITTLDKMPSKYATDTIKSKVVAYADASKSDFGGGLVAVNTNGTLYNETAGNQTIREYRYSGLNVDNYIYYNCKDNNVQNSTNCEVWRIIGIFKDADGNEHLKIVKNNVLTRDMFPATFSTNGTTYNIQYTSSGDYAYWNKKTSGDNYSDWETSGLQHWLNAGSGKETKKPSDGYMSYLSKNAKDMIEKSEYYLGTLTYEASGSVYGISETPKKAYVNERDVASCVNNTGSSSTGTASGCRVFSNNKAKWEGSIALLYPSDYGYSANWNYWDKSLKYGSFNGTASNSSWLQKGANHGSSEWLLSPSSGVSNGATIWSSSGDVNSLLVTSYTAVRTSLNLKSQAIIFDGEGTSGNPYRVKLGN